MKLPALAAATVVGAASLGLTSLAQADGNVAAEFGRTPPPAAEGSVTASRLVTSGSIPALQGNRLPSGMVPMPAENARSFDGGPSNAPAVGSDIRQVLHR